MTPESDPLFPPTLPPASYQFKSSRKKGRRKVADQRDSKRGGFYWIGGAPFPSVTEIITVLDKPALRIWFGREVFRAVVADPTIREKEALAAPYKVSDDAKSRGSTIHSIVAAWVHSQTYIDGIQEKYQGYAKAFYRWIEDNHIAIQEHERTVHSRKFGYAGTLDMLVVLNGTGRKLVVDVKTGKDIYPEAFLQLSAYRQALKEEGLEVDGVAVLLLQDDGGYKFEVNEQDLFRPFFACKVIWDWQHQDEMAQLQKHLQKGNGHAQAQPKPQ